MFNAYSSNTNPSPFGQPKPSGGLFSQQNKPPFGSNNNSSFGQPQNSYGQNAPGPNMFGSVQPQQPQQGGGIFGQSNVNQTGGMLGQNMAQGNPSGGLFGGAQQQQTGTPGLFGAPPTSNAFGNQQGNQGGIFGQAPQQPPQGGGLFGMQTNPVGGQPTNSQGQGFFGASNNSQGGGIFGQPNQNSGGFTAASNNINQSFLGNQGNSFQGNGNLFGAGNQSQGGAGLFGNTQAPSNPPFGNPPQASNNLFGAAQQPQPNAGGNSLFSTFANNNVQTNQAPQGNLFGGPNTTSNLFGQAQQGLNQNPTPFNANTSMNNKLGGTSWGVPTNPQGTQPIVGAQTISVQPIKSKNTKLDAKHLVKCITALDQFQGLSKEELRVNFIQTGGQQPALAQQQGNAGFKPLAPVANSGIPSLPSFGGSQNLGPAGGSNFFGNQASSNQPNLFAKPMGTAPTSGVFGNQQQQTNSLFGAQPQSMPMQPQTNSLFNAGNNASLYQQGNANSQQPQNSLFGATPAANNFNQTPAFTGNSLFNLPNNQTNFNQSPLQPPPSLFNTPNMPQNQTGTGTLFGMNNNSGNSLFGQPNVAQPPNFGQVLGNSILNSTPSYPNAYNTSLAPNPLNTTYPQTSTLFPQYFPSYPSSSMPVDPTSQQLYLGQVMMGFLSTLQQATARAATPAPTPAPATTPSTEPNSILSLFASFSKPQSQRQPEKKQTSNPFDQYLKEQYLNSHLSRPQKNLSLFSSEQIKYLQRAHHAELNNLNFSDSFSNTFNSRNRRRFKDSFDDDDNFVQTIVSKKEQPDTLSFFDKHKLRIVHRGTSSMQELAKKKYTPTEEQLPQLGQLQIRPSIDKLKKMTTTQLKKVDDVKVYNDFGAVQFLQPISLYKVDLSKIIKIGQDNLHIVDPILEEKKIRMTFNNFGKYTSLTPDQKRKLLKKMRDWIRKCDMIEISHNEDTGNLVVQLEQ